MSKASPFSLNGFIKNPDGTYSKAKTVEQPRDKVNTVKNSNSVSKEQRLSNRHLKLTLFGIPIPKQSVRATKSGHFFQPQHTIDRKADYKRQIKEQLPKDFKMFENEVHLTKFHCVFPPLKAFHKIKGRMDAIRNGEIFYKNTKPDLIDNLKKLCFDSMEDVLKNDSIIVTENDTAKYYGVGGCIIIELSGH